MTQILTKAVIAVAALATLFATFLSFFGRNWLKQAIISIAIFLVAVIVMASLRGIGSWPKGQAD
jgi:hypothetical protein